MDKLLGTVLRPVNRRGAKLHLIFGGGGSDRMERRKKRVRRVRRRRGEQESGEKGKRKNSERGRESVFILMCTQSKGSVSAIVPGLPVKTVRLPQRR